MKIISYAQNLEDVILWRALSQFGPGFYIDVGACDPDADSVTKLFYDAGWRGINIEPMPEAFSRISSARPNDINLPFAINDNDGFYEFYSIDNGNGLSTLNAEFAEQYRIEGKDVSSVQLESRTLSAICNNFVFGEIHFLKIDVEGFELNVIKGADFKKYRPWVVLVEATKPNTQEPSFMEWEPILLTSDYTFVYFDGLNRFYIANEKLSLLSQFFSCPPNVFDNYITSQSIDLKEKINSSNAINDTLHQLNEKINFELNVCNQELYESSRHIGYLTKEKMNLIHKAHGLENDIFQRDAAINSLRNENQMLHNEIHMLLSSKSWCITRPLRIIVAFIRKYWIAK